MMITNYNSPFLWCSFSWYRQFNLPFLWIHCPWKSLAAHWFAQTTFKRLWKSWRWNKPCFWKESQGKSLNFPRWAYQLIRHQRKWSQKERWKKVLHLEKFSIRGLQWKSNSSIGGQKEEQTRKRSSKHGGSYSKKRTTTLKRIKEMATPKRKAVMHSLQKEHKNLQTQWSRQLNNKKSTHNFQRKPQTTSSATSLTWHSNHCHWPVIKEVKKGKKIQATRNCL